MTELDILKQDLLKLQMQAEIQKDMKRPAFWLGLFFILISLILAVNFMII